MQSFSIKSLLWKMDETYIKIKGKWHYLYRAIDADGLTLDIWLRKKRDTQAAYAFQSARKSKCYWEFQLNFTKTSRGLIYFKSLQ